MAQPAQFKFTLPNNDFAVIDNASAPSFPVLSAGTHIGYDTVTGAVAQGINSFGDTGTVLLDPANDTVWADPQIATFKGNPVAMTVPTYAVLTKVLTNPQSATIIFKNPA